MNILEIIKRQSTNDIVQWLLIIGFLLIQLKITIYSFRNKTTKHAHWCQSVGMIGTFLGIVYGLLCLNTDDLFNSVNGLINGMSLAFITSLSGMILSHMIYYFVKESSETHDAELSDVVNAITGLDRKLNDNLFGIRHMIDSLQNSIVGKEEGTLLNQITLMRSHVGDKLDILNNSFGDFAKLQAENNTKALVEAIREVIGDFNTKLNEQFGENFKELNHAVGDLVNWQENYKETVEKSHEQFQKATTAIETSKNMLESIEKQYDSNMKINEDVKDSIGALKEEGLALNAYLESFNAMANNAKDVFPTIENNINKLTQGFAEKVDYSITSVTKYVESNHDSAKQVIEGFNESINNSLNVMQNSIENSNSAIQDSSNQMNQVIKDSVEDVTTNLTNSFSDAMNNISQIQQKIGENMENTILQIDEAHRQELENSLQSLGIQLASLSKRFVDDYSKVTASMSNLIVRAQS